MTDFNYIESRLGFYEIRCKLRDFCYTPVGKDFANDDFFSKDIKKIMQELGLTAEMKYINEFMGGVPALAFEDFRTELQQLKTQGSIAEIQVLRSIAFIIEKLVELKSLFSKNIEKTPFLQELISRINFYYSLAVRIGEIVDENGDANTTHFAAKDTGEARQGIEANSSLHESIISKIDAEFTQMEQMQTYIRQEMDKIITRKQALRRERTIALRSKQSLKKVKI